MLAILDASQELAIAHPADADRTVLVGAAGSGKSFALLARARRIALDHPGRQVFLTSTRARAGRAAFAADDLPTNVDRRDLAALAFEVLREAAPPLPEPDRIEDARAARIFEAVGARLFALDWTEFVSAEIDPEITGMRAPERFSATAFRLISRLRAANIDHVEFRRLCLRGTTEFYAKVPNFGGPDIKSATKPQYRDSLTVTPAELERQRLRELDLVAILTRLYDSYVDSLLAHGCLTATDALLAATRLLEREPQRARALRERVPYVCLDDAQDLTGVALAFLQLVYGARLTGVTLAGDGRQATRAFSGGRGESVLRDAATTFVFERPYRGDAALANVALRGFDPGFRSATSSGATPTSETMPVELHRASDTIEEAHFVAERIAELVRGGTAPARIAVIARSLAATPPFVDALLARNIPVDVAGSAPVFELAPVQDALAALWSLADPFRHDWLMRNLEAPWLNLSDATIAVLCAEPSTPQTLLFELPGDESEPRARWDRRRNLRLGRNVLRGDADADLGADARSRVVAFRAVRETWERLETELDLAALVRAVVTTSVLASADPGARGAYTADAIARFFEHVDGYAANDPLATLHDVLTDIEALVDGERSLLEVRRMRDAAVAVLDVEAAKGTGFDHVFVIDVRAGAFPRYYTPDAFIFTPTLGIVPKENVGDATSARTAKFTYTLFKTHALDHFIKEERRAFYVAASRARERLTITAAGRATKGVSAPEILEELRGARLAGVREVR